jgi:hypothetical protein
MLQFVPKQLHRAGATFIHFRIHKRLCKNIP